LADLLAVKFDPVSRKYFRPTSRMYCSRFFQSPRRYPRARGERTAVYCPHTPAPVERRQPLV